MTELFFISEIAGMLRKSQ